MIFSKKLLKRLLILTLLSLFFIYFLILKSNVKENGRLLVSEQLEINQIVNSADEYLQSPMTFKVMLTLVSNFKTIKAGSYRLEKGMSNLTILRVLIIGRQSPVKLIFNNQDTLEKLAGRISSEMEFDSISLLHEMKNAEFLAANKLDNETALAIYIPNTYEIYWNTTPKKFIEKMLDEYHSFWNENRLAKAKNLNLTPIQVSQ